MPRRAHLQELLPSKQSSCVIPCFFPLLFYHSHKALSYTVTLPLVPDALDHKNNGGQLSALRLLGRIGGPQQGLQSGSAFGRFNHAVALQDIYLVHKGHIQV